LHGLWAKARLNYDTVLEAYTLSEILELNDKTEAECLEYLVHHHYVELPEVLPIEFDE